MLVYSTIDYPVNCTDREVNILVEVLKITDPDEIEIITVSRPPAENHIIPVSDSRLKEIAFRFDEEFGRNRVKLLLKGLKRNRSSMKNENIGEENCDLILRRPCTFKQICASLGVDSVELRSIIAKLMLSGCIIEIWNAEEKYYKAA